MWSVIVEPGDKQNDFAAKVLVAFGHMNLARTLGFERPDRPLHHCDASVFADGTVPRRLDALAPDPFPEGVAVKDTVAIADDVFGRRAGTADNVA